MKIVGVGLNKTGTSTLKTCMKLWGLNHMTFDLPAFQAYQRADWIYLKQIADSHDSFENWPWALMHEQMYEWYPDAKFILSTRKSADTWFTSLSRHGKRIGPLTDYELYIYGYANPDENRQAHIDYYHHHNANVRKFFENKPGKLLSVCWEQGDDWAALSQFLQWQPPQENFPHSNKTPSYIDRIEQKVRPVLGRYKRKLFGQCD